MDESRERFRVNVASRQHDADALNVRREFSEENGGAPAACDKRPPVAYDNRRATMAFT